MAELVQVMEQKKAEAEVQGARSQSVFNSSLSFLGKVYAPLENSLSAHVASPDAGPNNSKQLHSPSTTLKETLMVACPACLAFCYFTAALLPATGYL